MAFNYIVKPGETIGDVVLNSTGSFNNWDVVLSANNFDTWTPNLFAGQQVLIPDTVVVDQNTLRQLKNYPACNISVNDVFEQIDNIIAQLGDNWILQTAFWNDSALWLDDHFWND